MFPRFKAYSMITNCNENHSVVLELGLIRAKELTKKLRFDISEYLKTTEYTINKKQKKKMLKAKYILKCAEWRSHSIIFSCTDSLPNERTALATYPIFGNTIYVATKYLDNRGDSSINEHFESNFDITFDAYIMHVLTHKCGTWDGDYFSPANMPHSKWFRGWQNIASTYEYWATYGVCLPEVDC